MQKEQFIDGVIDILINPQLKNQRFERMVDLLSPNDYPLRKIRQLPNAREILRKQLTGDLALGLLYVAASELFNDLMILSPMAEATDLSEYDGDGTLQEDIEEVVPDEILMAKVISHVTYDDDVRIDPIQSLLNIFELPYTEQHKILYLWKHFLGGTVNMEGVQLSLATATLKFISN